MILGYVITSEERGKETRYLQHEPYFGLTWTSDIQKAIIYKSLEEINEVLNGCDFTAHLQDFEGVVRIPHAFERAENISKRKQKATIILSVLELTLGKEMYSEWFDLEYEPKNELKGYNLKRKKY